MTEVHIVSDGTGGTTYITTPGGEKLHAVKAKVTLEGGSPNTVELELWMPSLDVKAEVQSVTFSCPHCGDIMFHTCQGAP